MELAVVGLPIVMALVGLAVVRLLIEILELEGNTIHNRLSKNHIFNGRYFFE